MRIWLGIGLLWLYSNNTLLYATTTADNAWQRGDYATAVQLWANPVAEETTAQQLQRDLQRCRTHRTLGNYRTANTLARRVLQTATAHSQPIYQLQAQLELSKLARLQDSSGTAGHWLNQALEQINQVGDPLWQAYGYYQQGNLAGLDNDWDLALDSYAQALTFAQQASFTNLPATQTHLLAQIPVKQALIQYWLDKDTHDDNTDPAIAYATSRHNIVSAWHAQQQHHNYLSLLARLQLTSLAHHVALPASQQLSWLQQTETLAKQLDHPLAKSKTYAGLRQLYQHQGQLSQALHYARQALFFAQQSGDKSTLYQAHWHLARLHAQQGQPQTAINSYQHAINNLNPIRQRVANTPRVGEVTSFRSHVAVVYFELVDLLLRQARIQTDKTTRYNLLNQAQHTLEELKTAELQNYFQQDCFGDMEMVSASASLDLHTAVVYPVVLSDRIEILLNLPDGELLQFTQMVSETALRDHIALLLPPISGHPRPEIPQRARGRARTENLHACQPLRQGQQAPALNKETHQRYLRPAQQLYQWLIAPLKPTLRNEGIDTLVVVADSVLRTIPFAVLHDGKQFLIEQFALAILPSLRVHATIFTKNQDSQAMLAGLSEARHGFSALPCAEYELNALQNLYTENKQFLINQDFVNQKLYNNLNKNDISIMHIASHGQFKARLDDTFILTYDSKLDLDKLAELVQVTTLRNKPIELLTLSACETAVGNDQAALGLAGIALKAGVHSAIASLWKVDDEATPTVILGFYQQLKQHQSKAKALQQAQLRLLHDDKMRYYHHPYFWSAFLLIGHWL